MQFCSLNSVKFVARMKHYRRLCWCVRFMRIDVFAYAILIYGFVYTSAFYFLLHLHAVDARCIVSNRKTIRRLKVKLIAKRRIRLLPDKSKHLLFNQVFFLVLIFCKVHNTYRWILVAGIPSQFPAIRYADERNCNLFMLIFLQCQCGGSLLLFTLMQHWYKLWYSLYCSMQSRFREMFVI